MNRIGAFVKNEVRNTKFGSRIFTYERLFDKSQWRCFLSFPLDWICEYRCKYCNNFWLQDEKTYFKKFRIYCAGYPFDF